MLIYTGEAAKKKYTSLREKFSREKRRSQQAGSVASSTRWVYMNSLQFLDPFVEGRATASNEHFEISTLKYDDDDDEEEDIPETATSSTTRSRRNVVTAASASSSGFAATAQIYKNDDEEISVSTQSSAVFGPRIASTSAVFTSSDEELEDATPSQAKRMKGNRQQSSTLATIQNVAKTLQNITATVNSQVTDSNNSRFLSYCDEMLLKMTPKRAELIKRKINYMLLDELELQELERN